MNLYETYVKSYIDFAVKIFWIYFIWILIHYISSHLYTYFCLPPTVLGFIMSPFMTTTPHCQALRWVIYTGGNSIGNMWIIIGTWFMQYVKPITLTTS